VEVCQALVHRQSQVTRSPLCGSLVEIADVPAICGVLSLISMLRHASIVPLALEAFVVSVARGVAVMEHQGVALEEA
jgi:hypothetical protein